MASSAPPPRPLVHVLMYHQVGHFDEPRAHRASYCHVDRFRAQMAFLKIAGYRVIGIGEALEGLYGGGPLPRR